MKKKLLGFILVLSMALTFTMSAFAAEGTPEDTVTADTVSDDAAVQTAYEAYQDILTAMEQADLEELIAAYEAFEAAAEALTNEQQAELTALDDQFYTNFFNGAFIIGMADLCDTYLADPNAKTATDFVTSYDAYVLIDEELAAIISEMVPDMADAYEQALTDMPSDAVLSVYEAYLKLVEGLTIGRGEDLDTGIAAFEAVTETFNALTEEESNDLALLLEAENGEEAWSLIFSDYVNANILNTVEDAYNAYAEDPTEETATAFVEMYDGIFHDPSYEDEVLRELVREMYPDIDDVYADASAFLAETEAPDTGDMGAAMPLMALFASAATAVLSSRKRKA